MTTTTPFPTVCLAMIIKNEGPLLPRLFKSIRGFVAEYCIVDTGSTDDTIEVLTSMEMPGTIYEEAFVDFGTTRNILLQKCRETTSCDYLLLLDADMILCRSPEWDWAKFNSRIDVYSFIQVSALEYENVRLIRRDAIDVKVVGSTHEYYDVPSHYNQGTIPKHLIYIRDVGDGKCKEDKFSRDEKLLRRDLDADSSNPRTMFYLANTLKDQAKYAEAIPFYIRRTQMDGFFAEADLSFTCLVQCFLGLDDLGNAEKYAFIAAYRPTAQRAEPLYYLAFYLHSKQKYDMAWYYAHMAGRIPKPSVAQALFIHNDIYEYWVDYEQATLPQYVFPEDKMLGMQKAVHFLNNNFTPDYLRHIFAQSTLPTYAMNLTAEMVKHTKNTSGSNCTIYSKKNDTFEQAMANNPRIFDFLTESTLPIVEYYGDYLMLAPFQVGHLYTLIVRRTDQSVKSYTYPFSVSIDNNSTIDLVGIVWNQGIPFLRVRSYVEEMYDIPLAKIMALTI